MAKSRTRSGRREQRAKAAASESARIEADGGAPLVSAADANVTARLQATYLPEGGRLFLWTGAPLSAQGCKDALKRLGLTGAGPPLDAGTAVLFTPSRVGETLRLDARRISGQALASAGAVSFARLARAPASRTGDAQASSASLRAWARAALFGLELVAAQRLAPRWRALDRGIRVMAGWAAVIDRPDDRRRFQRLAASMPLAAHAAAVTGGRALSAGAALRAFLDDFADALVRAGAKDTELRPPAGGWEPRWLGALIGPAAESTIAVSDAEAHLPRELARWTAPLLAGDDVTRVCFRLDPPAATGARWRLEVGLEVTAGEETAWIPARAALASPTPDIEADGRLLRDGRGRLNAALTLAHSLLPCLSTLAHGGGAPIELDDDDAGEFLARAAPELRIRDIDVVVSGDVRVPTSHRVVLRLHEATAATSGERPGEPLGGLLDFQWAVAIGGTTVSADEFRGLVANGRVLVELRNEQWMLPSQWRTNVERRLRELESTRLEPIRLIAAALIGELEAGHERVPVTGGDALRRLLEGPARGDGNGGAAAAPSGFCGTLRPYQARGTLWLARLAEHGLGGVLADDMGLGKTIQAIALILRDVAAGTAPGPTLVVCPASVLGNWEHELARFAPGLAIVRHHGPERSHAIASLLTAPERVTGAGGDNESATRDGERPDDVVVLTSYGTLARDADLLAAVHWRRVVLDEAQNVKNPDTVRARTARRLPAAQRLALTGTPVENRVDELWSLLDFVNPGLLGGRGQFRRRFALPIERDRDGRAAERLRRVAAPFVLRRVKTDPAIAADLPDKQQLDTYCTLTTEQAALYQAAVEDALQRIAGADGITRRGRVLALITALKQIADHPALYLREDGPLTGRSGKLARLLEMLDEVADIGECALIFTQYRRMGALLVDELSRRLDRPVPFLHGAVAARGRDALVREFQEGDAAPFFVLSLRAGGLGLNLTRANHVFHYDRWWNPAVEDQATDRAHRIGQSRDVQVHRFITLGTLEERIAHMLDEKRALADAIIAPGETWITELPDAELRELVALRTGAVIDDDAGAAPTATGRERGTERE